MILRSQIPWEQRTLAAPGVYFPPKTKKSCNENASLNQFQILK